ncbi:MAG: DUF2911 domain-containing protein [Bacteroidota bacterium]
MGKLRSIRRGLESWRNNATNIFFSTDVSINGEILPKGEYAFFVVPRKDQDWIGIFNKNSKQWGAFSYDSNEDALRIKMKPDTLGNVQENLTYQIQQYEYDSASILLLWDRIALNISFKTQYVQEFIKNS